MRQQHAGYHVSPRSPPFIDQLERGRLVDMRTHREIGHRCTPLLVDEVTPGGLAEQRGLKAGDRITDIRLPDQEQFHRMRSGQTVADATILAAGQRRAAGDLAIRTVAASQSARVPCADHQFDHGGF